MTYNNPTPTKGITTMFNEGDQAICTGSRGYDLTTGKVYTILKYEPSYHDCNGVSGFTWPAYVKVTDDYGKIVHCHAHRFKPAKRSPHIPMESQSH